MKNNKYGIILYRDTVNLGDDIQTYAAYKLLPKVDYEIDREEISYFVPKKAEKIKVIMNGWFNHDKTKFLIPPYIDPLYISMHFSENDLVLVPGYTFLTGYAKEIMNKNKIGCRDKTTLKVLKELGYSKAYFSSCLTTTINPIGKKEEKDYIVAVDMNPKIVKHLKEITDYKIIETSHWIFLKKNISYEEKIKKIKEYEKLSPEERKKWVEDHAKLSLKDRMKIVEEQLKLYQNAKMVITDRIHVALPCLGLKTNVLLIYYDYNKDRIETFKEFLSNTTEDEFLKMTKEELFKVKNSNKYVKYREKIISEVEEFLEKETDTSNVPKVDDYKEFLKREDYIKKLYQEKIDELTKENNMLEEENKKNKKDAMNYQKISNSRTWKIIGKYYKNKLL